MFPYYRKLAEHKWQVGRQRRLAIVEITKLYRKTSLARRSVGITNNFTKQVYHHDHRAIFPTIDVVWRLLSDQPVFLAASDSPHAHDERFVREGGEDAQRPHVGLPAGYRQQAGGRLQQPLGRHGLTTTDNVTTTGYVGLV